MGWPARGHVAAGEGLRAVILVTGASGFVGRHVMRALHARGIPACGASRHPERTGGVPMIRLDLDRTKALPGFDQLGRPKTVIHLAWGGLPHFKSQHHLDTELDTQWRFLEHLVKQGLERLVVAGTCLEYGMQEGELTESMPAMPSVPYAQAKFQLCKRLEALSSAQTLCLHLGTTLLHARYRSSAQFAVARAAHSSRTRRRRISHVRR